MLALGLDIDKASVMLPDRVREGDGYCCAWRPSGDPTNSGMEGAKGAGQEICPGAFEPRSIFKFDFGLCLRTRAILSPSSSQLRGLTLADANPEQDLSFLAKNLFVEAMPPLQAHSHHRNKATEELTVLDTLPG
jgi:hypothetical protein